MEYLRHRLEVERADDWEQLNYEVEKLNWVVVEVIERKLEWKGGAGEEGEGGKAEQRWPWVLGGGFPAAKKAVGLVGDRVRLISDILSVREEDRAKSLQDQ